MEYGHSDLFFFYVVFSYFLFLSFSFFYLAFSFQPPFAENNNNFSFCQLTPGLASVSLHIRCQSLNTVLPR